MKLIDLTNRRFGRILVLRRAPNGAGHHPYWVCRCDCGSETIKMGQHLKSGRTQSCGCLRRERAAEEWGATKLTHGLSKTPEYAIWCAMKNRCLNKNNAAYNRYAGRGITICQRWRSFENFYADMGPRPSNAHSLERSDNDGNYEPGNVRWATRVEQANNTRSNRLVTFRRREMTFRNAWRLAGGTVSYGTAHWRIQHGWPLERALLTPNLRPRKS